MHRAVTIAAVAMLATAACSSAGDDADSSAAAAESDPIVAFCADWDRFDQLTNSEDEDDAPTEALVQEVVDLQDELGSVLPDGLDAAWASILDWNGPFIEWFQTAGYQEPSDEVIVDLLGGEAAAEAKAQEREEAYESIRSWSRTNCPASDDATFCDLWPPYNDLLQSDPEPTEELIGQLLEMQDGIDEVLPPELAASWAGIADWNQAFIDVFEQTGYQPLTTELFLEAFGGDEEAAGAAEEAMEAGFTSVRSWTASNCTDGSAYASAFCEHWDEFAFLTADEDAMTPESYDEAIAVIDRVGDEVPAEIREDWNAVVESARGFHDLLVSVNFEPDRITDDLLEQAFGSVEAAMAMEEAGDAGRAAIEEWALTGCGDFCSRWAELRQALDETGGHDLGWVVDMGDDEGRSRLADHVRAFEIGSQLVPDEIRGHWELAVAARHDWIAWWDAFEFSGDELQLIDFPNETVAARDIAVEMMRDAEYLIDDQHTDLHLEDVHARVIAAWQDGADAAAAELLVRDIVDERERAEIAALLDGSGEPEWLVEYWRRGPIERVGHQLTATLDAWVGENCEALTGQPGTVRVQFPRIEGAAGDTLVLALMERGASFEDLTDQERVLAGTCAQIENDPWGVWRDEHGREERWESEEFRGERWEEGALCDYRWEEGPARLDAGGYTMLAAVIEGGPGRQVIGTATACSAFDVRIDGDTMIDVPALPPCDVGLGGADDPWRNPPPVDPSTPGAGTLQIVFPEFVGGGEVLVVALPAGTTLNDVGREQVWPAGATRTWLIDEMAIEEGRTVGAVAVPVAELPASGSARALEPLWLAARPPADRLPLAVLAPGAYDVHVQIAVHDPPEQEYSDRAKNDRCGTFEVTIAGDTIVDLPELGECPRVA